MALRLDASGDSLSRTASLPSIQSFTICGVSVINSDRGDTAQGVATWGPEVLAYLLWEYGFGDGRMAVGSWDGGTESVGFFTNKPATGARFFWYLRCSGGGSNLLQAGWMPFGDTAFTEQRSTTIRPGSGTAIYLGNSSYGEHSNADFGAAKVWNVALSDAELLAEAASERAVKTSGLLIDSPMTGANVTEAAEDLSGNNYDWTVGGTLAVVAGPSYGTSVAPGAGALEAEGFAPIITTASSIAALAGALEVEGFAPAVGTASTVAPPAGSLEAQGFSPTLQTSTAVAPGLGPLTFTGLAPTLNSPSVTAPLAGALQISGFAPALTSVTSLAPGLGGLTLAGYAPTPTSASTVAPAAGALEAEGYAPTLTEAGVAPGLGRLHLRGYSPTLYGLAPVVEKIPPVNNLEQLRKQTNAILEAVQAAIPGYGTALPAVDEVPDGKLFVRSDEAVIYQKQNGAWVAIDGTP